MICISHSVLSCHRIRCPRFRNAEKHKQDVQVWETKYDILKKRYFVICSLRDLIDEIILFSMMVLRDEMYTRQTHVRDRFTVKPAVVTYN